MRWMVLMMAVSMASAATAAQPEPQPIAPERMAAAERFLDSMHYDQLVEKTLETVMADSQRALEAKLKADFGDAIPGRVARDIASIARRHIDAAIKDNRNTLRKGTVTIYARHFTVEELERLAAIQSDPVMVKYLDELPQISAESMALSRAAMEREQDKMAAEIKALIDDFGKGPASGPST